MSEKIRARDIEDSLNIMENKLRGLSALFFCCDDIVSMKLNCEQLNGLSSIRDDFADEISELCAKFYECSNEIVATR
jgi:hypothetical protein